MLFCEQLYTCMCLLMNVHVCVCGLAFSCYFLHICSSATCICLAVSFSHSRHSRSTGLQSLCLFFLDSSSSHFLHCASSLAHSTLLSSPATGHPLSSALHLDSATGTSLQLRWFTLRRKWVHMDGWLAVFAHCSFSPVVLWIVSVCFLLRVCMYANEHACVHTCMCICVSVCVHVTMVTVVFTSIDMYE